MRVARAAGMPLASRNRTRSRRCALGDRRGDLLQQLGIDAADFGQALRRRGDDLEHGVAERLDHPPGQPLAQPLDDAGGEIGLDRGEVASVPRARSGGRRTADPSWDRRASCRWRGCSPPHGRRALCRRRSTLARRGVARSDAEHGPAAGRIRCRRSARRTPATCSAQPPPDVAAGIGARTASIVPRDGPAGEAERTG